VIVSMVDPWEFAFLVSYLVVVEPERVAPVWAGPEVPCGRPGTAQCVRSARSIGRTLAAAFVTPSSVSTEHGVSRDGWKRMMATIPDESVGGLLGR
jgi:hypothetical protein